MCGDISKKYSGWPQNSTEDHVVPMKCNNQKVSETSLKESLQDLFNRDEEIKTEDDLTYEEEYAIQLFKRTIKRSSKGIKWTTISMSKSRIPKEHT